MKRLIFQCLLSALALPVSFAGAGHETPTLAEDKRAFMKMSARPGSALVAQDAGDRPLLQLIARESAVTPEHGMEVYKADCVACHGVDRAGVNSTFPSLIGISRRYSDIRIAKQIRNGKGRMLAFPYMTDDDMRSLLLFLKTPAARKSAPMRQPANGTF